MFIVVSEMILERDPQEELAKAFKLFDDDDTGKISVNVILHLLLL